LAGFVLLIFGLVDDHASRRGGGLSPTIRVVVEVWAAVALWWAGLRPQLLGNVWLDAIVVVIFLVACVNAFNLLDNMDGVAGATAAATAAGLFGLAYLSGQPEVAWLAAAVSGGALGFLRHNLVAARIFLGNGGTLFLGFVIGALALRLRVSAEPPWSLLAAVAALGVPVMDTSIVIVSRLRARRSPFKGGVDHLSHRLVRLGFTSRSAALLHATGAALGGVVAFFAVLFSRMEPIAGVIGAFGIAAVLFLKMTIYESDPIEGDAPGIGVSLVPDVGDGETSAEKSTLAPEEAT
jgi:UDP-GlcNAc:undecaprenyl-phosphate GlcNAc-1-phosphate transferase